VVTYDNLVLTRMCLESVLANTESPGYEVVAVDNASGDGTREYLLELAQLNPHVRLVLNSSNVGFARACNQALTIARGDVFVLLDSDTLVLPGWLAKLAEALGDKSVGVAGPVTNRMGNEMEIEEDYETWGELVGFAARRARDHVGKVFDVRTVTTFCLAMRRDTFERIGPLDDRFEIGLFEDAD
jgi:GT2 family glycosyltransferase